MYQTKNWVVTITGCQFITEDGAFTFFVGANSIDCLEETVEITF